MMQEPKSDLIVLAADRNIESAISGLLSRQESLGIRQIDYKIFSHTHHDPGCLRESHSFLRNFVDAYSYAMVIFDRVGCGNEIRTREELEADVEHNLNTVGWNGRSIALVLDPELEIWVWKDSPHVASALGWPDNIQFLRSWLIDSGYLTEGDIVPRRPKEAMEAVLRINHKPRSSAIYKQLAETVGLNRCKNPTFIKFRQTIGLWFPRR